MIRKFFSSLLVIIIVPVFMAFLITMSLKFSLLNPNFYKFSFQKTEIYTKILDQGVPALLDSVGEEGKFGLGNLDANDITQILKSSISPAWLKNQIDPTITKFFDFAYGKDSNLEIVVSLSEIKQSVAENLSKSFQAKIDSLPPCTSEELRKLQSQNQEEGFSFNCKPSGTSSADLEEMVMASVTGKEGLLSQLPDEYNVGELILKNPAANKVMPRFFTIYGMIFKVLTIALIIIISLLILINSKYLPRALKWISIPLMIPSAIVLILALIGHLLAAGLIGGYLTILPGELKSVATQTAIDLIGQLFSKFEIYSGIVLGSAIILLIIAIILSKKYPYQLKDK